MFQIPGVLISSATQSRYIQSVSNISQGEQAITCYTADKGVIDLDLGKVDLH